MKRLPPSKLHQVCGVSVDLLLLCSQNGHKRVAWHNYHKHMMGTFHWPDWVADLYASFGLIYKFLDMTDRLSFSCSWPVRGLNLAELRPAHFLRV